MEKRASKWPEMHSQRHTFSKISRGSTPGPPSNEQGLPHPGHGLRRSVQVFGLKGPPVHDPSGSSPDLPYNKNNSELIESLAPLLFSF